MTDDNRAPLTVKEMLIDISGKFDVLNTELKYDRASTDKALERLHLDIERARLERVQITMEATQSRERLEAEIREVRERKTISPKELWSVVLGVLGLGVAVTSIFM